MHWRKRNRKRIWNKILCAKTWKCIFAVLVRWHDRVSTWHDRVRVSCKGWHDCVSRWHDRVRFSCKGWHDRVSWWRDCVSSAEFWNLVFSCFCVLLSMPMDSKHLTLFNQFIIKLLRVSYLDSNLVLFWKWFGFAI